MPILEVETVGDPPEGAAQRIADLAGAQLGLPPGRLWVRLRGLDPDRYAENGGDAPRPAFVHVLEADVPAGDAFATQMGSLTDAVAEALQRPRELVHLIYEPPGAGRVAFGGQLVEPRPTRVGSGAPWAQRVGYSRAVRDRGHVYVTGTAPVSEDGGTFAPGQPYEQAHRCLVIIEQSLRELGLDREAIVRTRMFVTDISQWDELGRAHREFFGGRGPATTMVEVRRLIDDDMLVEIEADARG